MPDCSCGAPFAAHLAIAGKPAGATVTLFFCPGPAGQAVDVAGPVAASLYTPVSAIAPAS